MNDQNYFEQWESLSLSNDFIFSKVFTTNKDLCMDLLRAIFPEKKILDIEYPAAQKSFQSDIDSRGIRLDVYVEDNEKRVFDLEMQVVNKKDLPNRMRYYNSMLDTSELERGEGINKGYLALKEHYIVFICLFDFYNTGRHKYTFRSRCEEDHDILFGDNFTAVVLNAKGTRDDVGGNLAGFLNIVAGKEWIESDFTTRLINAVDRAKRNKDWRRQYMTLEMKFREIRAEAHEEGRAEAERDTIFGLVKDDIISEECAANRLKMELPYFVGAYTEWLQNTRENA